MVEGVTGPLGVRPGAETPSAAARDTARSGGRPVGARFEDALARVERSQLDFSKHARRRIEQRGLQLDAGRMERLEQAVERAEAKGARESLILLDELALVVSVQNHRVVTAIDQANRKEHVFTNIDSVVIAE